MIYSDDSYLSNRAVRSKLTSTKKNNLTFPKIWKKRSFPKIASNIRGIAHTHNKINNISFKMSIGCSGSKALSTLMLIQAVWHFVAGQTQYGWFMAFFLNFGLFLAYPLRVWFFLNKIWILKVGWGNLRGESCSPKKGLSMTFLRIKKH